MSCLANGYLRSCPSSNRQVKYVLLLVPWDLGFTLTWMLYFSVLANLLNDEPPTIKYSLTTADVFVGVFLANKLHCDSLQISGYTQTRYNVLSFCYEKRSSEQLGISTSFP